MTDNTNRLAGVAFLTIRGRAVRLAADAEYQVSGSVRETLTGQDGVHGYKETPIPGHIFMTARDANDVSVADFDDMTNETVTLELANGKLVIGRNMWKTEAIAVKTAEGTFELKFEGPDVTEN